MSLAAGHPLIAIPGPSPLPERVLRAANRASPDIYGEELATLNQNVMAQLKRLAGTKAHIAPYIGNGHAAWEASAVNLFNRGDKALVITSGMFGRSWADFLGRLGVAIEVLDFGNDVADPAVLAARLANDRADQIKAVLLCHIDTASGCMTDIPAIKAAMGDHPALLVVDAIASLGCAPMLMDDWDVDVLISASQKGLMSMPGASFVWFSDRVAQRGPTDLTTPYWNWHNRKDATELWAFWGGTPPVQLLFALDEALRLILDEQGLVDVWSRHAGLARAVWAAVDAWSAGNPAIHLGIADPANRAASVTTIFLPGADRLRAWVSANCGVTLGVGLGADIPDGSLRLAHMGHCNAAMMLGALGAMQAGLIALAIPHGQGALEAAARVIAEPV